MNKQRRKQLRDTVLKQLDDAKGDLAIVAGEEQDAFDNMPEGIQYSEKGEAIEEMVQDLEEIEGEIEDLISRIEEITG